MTNKETKQENSFTLVGQSLKLNRLLITFIILLLGYSLNAQKIDVAALEAKYPTRDVVFLKYNTHLDFDVKDGKLLVTSHTEEEKIFLTEKAKLYEEESIHYYGENKILDLKAESRSIKGKKRKVKDIKLIETISQRNFFATPTLINFLTQNLEKEAQEELLISNT